MGLFIDINEWKTATSGTKSGSAFRALTTAIENANTIEDHAIHAQTGTSQTSRPGDFIAAADGTTYTNALTITVTPELTAQRQHHVKMVMDAFVNWQKHQLSKTLRSDNDWRYSTKNKNGKYKHTMRPLNGELDTIEISSQREGPIIDLLYDDLTTYTRQLKLNNESRQRGRIFKAAAQQLLGEFYQGLYVCAKGDKKSNQLWATYNVVNAVNAGQVLGTEIAKEAGITHEVNAAVSAALTVTENYVTSQIPRPLTASKQLLDYTLGQLEQPTSTTQLYNEATDKMASLAGSGASSEASGSVGYNLLNSATEALGAGPAFQVAEGIVGSIPMISSIKGLMGVCMWKYYVRKASQDVDDLWRCNRQLARGTTGTGLQEAITGLLSAQDDFKAKMQAREAAEFTALVLAVTSDVLALATGGLSSVASAGFSAAQQTVKAYAAVACYLGEKKTQTEQMQDFQRWLNTRAGQVDAQMLATCPLAGAYFILNVDDSVLAASLIDLEAVGVEQEMQRLTRSEGYFWGHRGAITALRTNSALVIKRSHFRLRYKQPRGENSSNDTETSDSSGTPQPEMYGLLLEQCLPDIDYQKGYLYGHRKRSVHGAENRYRQLRERHQEILNEERSNPDKDYNQSYARADVFGRQ
jgi:hypothetical protein